MSDLKYGWVTVKWLTTRDLLNNKKLNEAKNSLDELLSILGEHTLRGVKKIDGVSMDIWKERVWLEIEKNFGLPEIEESFKL